MIFKNELHNEFGTWPLGYIPYGGIDYGEIMAVADRIGNGDDAAYYDSWMKSAEQFASDAAAALDAKHPAVARELFLKASECYAASYHPIYGFPVDPRLLTAFDKQTQNFEKAMSLSDDPVSYHEIPFEDTHLPAWFIPAAGRANEKRPLIIFTNGYDATITDLWFFAGSYASQRGYHCILFDGPGQGEMLYKKNLPLRPDWEAVVSAVLDIAEKIAVVDNERIAVYGLSLGGYLAPRATSGDARIKACIADPGQYSVANGFRRALVGLHLATSEEVKDLSNLSPEILEKMSAVISGNRKLTWTIVQRGFWANGVNNLKDFFSVSDRFTMEGRVQEVRCPTLLTLAENDSLTAETELFYEALSCPKKMIRFPADRGAGDHCEMMNRSLVNRLSLDWLDEVFQ